MTRRALAVWMLAAVIGLGGCGGGDDAGSGRAREPARAGAELFGERILATNAGCITCHSLDPGTTLVGPSIAGIATRAAERRPGVAAEDYIRESIVDPSAYVVAGFDDGRMPADWAEVLAVEEIDALVAYLLTLR